MKLPKLSCGCLLWSSLILIVILAWIFFATYQSVFPLVESTPKLPSPEITMAAQLKATSMGIKMYNDINATPSTDLSKKVKVTLNEAETNALLHSLSQSAKLLLIPPISSQIPEEMKRLIPEYQKSWVCIYEDATFKFYFNANTENAPKWTFIPDNRAFPIRIDFRPYCDDLEYKIDLISGAVGGIYIPNAFLSDQEPRINAEIEKMAQGFPEGLQFRILEDGQLEITYYPGRLHQFLQYEAKK